MSVALCVLRFEICDLTEDSEETGGAMALQDGKLQAMRGRRKPREIVVETYQAKDEPSNALLEDSGLPTTSFTERSSSLSQASKPETSGVKDDQIPFVSGNPFVEVTKGILHLYKEDQLTNMENAPQSGQTVCILSVPATMTCHDLLSFIAACQESISCVRIIRDSSVNQYMTLITFRSQQAAKEFYHLFKGVPFNSLEPDVVCHLVFVSRVEIIGENDSGAIPPRGHTELPMCPVCLERMDESVDGILTILCNHSFHGTCLAKWGDISCPVCRYVQTPEVVADNFCSECQTSADSLWICLICGHVGCGRYNQGHAYEHYVETQHCYSMQLGNNRVWDYVGDNFVHRLLLNKGDGKLVEGESEKAEDPTDKMDSVQLEFSYLLTSQLDSQRQYFEEKLSRLESQRLCELTDLKDTTRKAVEDKKKLEQKLSAIMKEKQSNDKKLHQVSSRLSQSQAELSDERQISQALQESQAAWQAQFNSLEKEFKELKTHKDDEMKELKEQIRDLMFALEAQNIIANSDHREEIAEGQIVVGSSAEKPSASRRRKKR